MMEARPSQFSELCAFRDIMQSANRIFRWSAVYTYNVGFWSKLANGDLSGFDQLNQTLYITVFNVTALHSDARQCAQSKSHDQLASICLFHSQSLMENETHSPIFPEDAWKESTGSTKAREGATRHCCLVNPVNKHTSARAVHEITPWQIAQSLPKPWSPFQVATWREVFKNHHFSNFFYMTLNMAWPLATKDQNFSIATQIIHQQP